MQEVDQKELSVMKGFVTKLENQANSIVIESKESYIKAVDLVSTLKATGSKIKEKKEGITKPLNEALRNVRLMFKPIEDQFLSAEKIIKGKLLEYKHKADEEARKKEEQIASRVENGSIKLGTAEKKIDAIERVDSTTQGKTGEVQVRIVKKVKIVDEKLIPREYLVPDMVAIRRDALSGKQIDGVEVYSEEQIAAGTLKNYER